MVLLLCELNRLLVVEEVGEEEDVGDDVDEVEDDKDVGVVALGDVVGVVGQEEEGGEEAQQEDLVGQSLEGDRVLDLGQTWRTTQRRGCFHTRRLSPTIAVSILNMVKHRSHVCLGVGGEVAAQVAGGLAPHVGPQLQPRYRHEGGDRRYKRVQ